MQFGNKVNFDEEGGLSCIQKLRCSLLPTHNSAIYNECQILSAKFLALPCKQAHPDNTNGVKASLESSRQACFHGSAKTLWWHSTTIIIAWRVVWSIYFTCIHSNRLRRERQKEQISKELWHQRRNLFVSGLESTHEVRGTVNRKLHKSVVCLKSSLAED